MGDCLLSRLENCLELFPEVSNYNNKDLRLHVWPIVEAIEGKWGGRGNTEKGNTSWGGTSMWGVRYCRISV
jgi:hypothetical protein